MTSTVKNMNVCRLRLLSTTTTTVPMMRRAATRGHAAPNPLAGDIRAIYCDNHHFDTDLLGVFGQTAERFGEGEVVDFGSFQMDFEDVILLIALFMLLGVTGKSAQIPLFVWLPDAMAGPTPVSALIHAATMVTAGIFILVRSNVFLWELNHAGYVIGLIITLVGVSTALMSGFIALGQWDIKRVLAYSTISQLGFMLAAVGIGAYVAAMFHLVTHAVFKALLFLGSGSVIHGVEHGHHHAHANGDHGDDHDEHHDDDDFDPQDMRNMGGLRKRMPITYITYLIGTLALAGIFPFAGFWSKDEILADAWYEGFELNELSGFLAFRRAAHRRCFHRFLHVAADRPGLLRRRAQRSRRTGTGEQWRDAAAALHLGDLYLHHRLDQRAGRNTDLRWDIRNLRIQALPRA